jgi:hypothetical protein
MYSILNNAPSAGYIQWSSVNIQYNGVSYAIANGYTNYTYVYWLASSPSYFVVSDTFPALTSADVLVFLNKSGIAMVVPSATILDGGLIVPGSIYAAAIAANTITGNEIAAGAISASELAANSVIAGKVAANAITAGTVAANAIGAEAIAAGAITADKIVAGAITGDKIAAATITANKLVAGTITAASGIIADAAITNAKIADATIQSAKIASLDAGKVTTGTLQSATGNSWISLANGQFSFGNGALAWNGTTLNAQGIFEAVSGSYTAKLGDGAVRFFSSGVEVGQVSTYLASPTGPWLAASSGGKTIDLGKFLAGSGYYTAYKIDFGTTSSTTATHRFWGTVTLNGHPLSCGALTSGAVTAEGIVSCWRVEPHLDNNDRCGTSTKRWQAVHALEGYFNKLTIGSNTCWAAGAMTLTTASWASVSFGKTFPSAPRVFGQFTHSFTGDIGALKIRNISTTGFEATIGGSGFSGISANWFAVLV